MFTYFEQILISYANSFPLEVFSFVISFFDEVIPPIPSPSVMLITGSLAQVQGYIIPGLILLAMLGGLGKTFGAGVVYFVVDKVEDIFSSKIGKFLGISHEQIESFGARLSGGPKDYIIMTVLRAIPIVPSTLISIGSGLLKINFKLFVVSTFIGSVIRDFIYLYFGYVGTTVALSFVKKTADVESFVEIGVVLCLVLLLGFLYYRRKKIEV